MRRIGRSTDRASTQIRDGRAGGGGGSRHLSSLLILLMLLLQGCGGDADPETRIREMLAAGEQAVESRSLGRVEELVSSGYRDESGRVRKDVMRLFAGYFLRNQSIHLLVQVQEIRLQGEERAEVSLVAAVGRRQAEDLRQLAGISADIFRLDLRLRREGDDWLVASGRWRRVDMGDFLQ